MYSFTLAPCSLGWIGLVRSPRGLCYVAQPMPYAGDAGLNLVTHFGAELSRDDNGFGSLVSLIQRNLAGELVDFSSETLDLSAGTPFQQRVWAVVRGIPFAETRTYAWVAAEAEKPGAARAAGQAVGANPVPIIIPCHRVVGSSGKLTGFGWGLALKQQLLDTEQTALQRLSQPAPKTAVLI